jgi:hypothetical protein
MDGKKKPKRQPTKEMFKHEESEHSIHSEESLSNDSFSEHLL